VVVIALDTSHARGGVALAVDGRPAGERKLAQTSHLVDLAGAADALLRAAGLGARGVSRVAVVSGPGSFTGLRVGLAWAKGLCAGTGAEMVTMGSLELIARAEAGAGLVCTMIDARRDEVYGALFRAAGPGGHAPVEAIVAPCARAPEAFLRALPERPARFVGTGALRYAQMVRDAFPGAAVAGEAESLPPVALLAALAPSLPALDADALRRVEPVYLRASVARPLKPIDADGRTED